MLTNLTVHRREAKAVIHSDVGSDTANTEMIKKERSIRSFSHGSFGNSPKPSSFIAPKAKPITNAGFSDSLFLHNVWCELERRPTPVLARAALLASDV